MGHIEKKLGMRNYLELPRSCFLMQGWSRAYKLQTG